jgi:hypothetical protein
METSQGNSLCSYLYLKQAKMMCFLFYKMGEKEDKTDSVGGRGWEGGDVGEREYEGEYCAKNVYTCV